MNHYKQGTNIWMFWKINCMESISKKRIVGHSKHETITLFEKEWHPKDSIMDYWWAEGLKHHKKCELPNKKVLNMKNVAQAKWFNKNANTTGGVFIQDSKPKV